MLMVVVSCNQAVWYAMWCREGVDLLGHQPGLRPNCFVAMEAVKWLMDKISGTVTRAEAVKAFQVTTLH